MLDQINQKDIVNIAKEAGDAIMEIYERKLIEPLVYSEVDYCML